MWKGKDFTSWGIWKKVGKSVISVYKDAKKRLADAAILWLWKSRENFLVSCVIHISKTVHLQQLKGMPSSKLLMWKGYLLSIEGTGKGHLFCPKWCIKGKGVGPWGGESPYKTFLGISPGFVRPPALALLACVASVSNRVIARKVERKQKMFFCSCPSFLDEPREETLATQAIALRNFFEG